MKARIIKKDNMFDRLISELSQLADKEVDIGWIGGREHSSGYTDAELAYGLEYGMIEDSKGTPIEPFLLMETVSEVFSPRVDGKVHIKVRNVFNSLLRPSVNDKALAEIGKYYKHSIQSTMGDPFLLRSNKELTIILKGDDAPMIDSGELMRNVTYKTHKGVDGE